MEKKTKIILLSSIGALGIGALSYYVYRRLKYNVVKEGTFTILVEKDVKNEDVEVVPEDSNPTITTNSQLVNTSVNNDTWGDYIAYEDFSFGDYEQTPIDDDTTDNENYSETGNY
jgi:hypothetical protein